MRLRVVVDLDASSRRKVFALGNKVEHIPAEVAVGPGQQIHERRHGREVGEVRPARAGLDMLQYQRREDEVEPLLTECCPIVVQPIDLTGARSRHRATARMSNPRPRWRW